MTNQLTQMQDNINILKANNTMANGKYSSVYVFSHGGEIKKTSKPFDSMDVALFSVLDLLPWYFVQNLLWLEFNLILYRTKQEDWNSSSRNEETIHSNARWHQHPQKERDGCERYEQVWKQLKQFLKDFSVFGCIIEISRSCHANASFVSFICFIDLWINKY